MLIHSPVMCATTHSRLRALVHLFLGNTNVVKVKASGSLQLCSEIIYCAIIYPSLFYNLLRLKLHCFDLLWNCGGSVVDALYDRFSHQLDNTLTWPDVVDLL